MMTQNQILLMQIDRITQIFSQIVLFRQFFGELIDFRPIITAVLR